MGKHNDLGQMVLSALQEHYVLRQNDIGADALMRKKGMTFQNESYAFGNTGHLFIMRMNAMMGMMKMETVVLSVNGKDVPLFNLDWIGAMGKETQLNEFYDTQLRSWTKEEMKGFLNIQDQDSDIPEYESGAHWYDPILMECSYRKTGKGFSERFNEASEAYMKEYLRLLEEAPPCDIEAKKAKNRDFAETLFAKGGPAVDQFEKLFGKEAAGRIVLRHMYGVTE